MGFNQSLPTVLLLVNISVWLSQQLLFVLPVLGQGSLYVAYQFI